MTNITTATADARESARQRNGEFGRQAHSAPDAALDARTITQILSDAGTNAQRRRLELAQNLPGAAADLLRAIAPQVQKARFESWRHGGDDHDRVRMNTVVIDGVEREVNWDDSPSQLSEEDKLIRHSADTISRATAHFADHSGAMHALSGVQFNPEHEYWELDISAHAPEHTGMDALNNMQRLTGELRAEHERWDIEREHLAESIPDALGEVMKALPEDAEYVTARFEGDSDRRLKAFAYVAGEKAVTFDTAFPLTDGETSAAPANSVLSLVETERDIAAAGGEELAGAPGVYLIPIER